jgi:Cupin superfamily protein
MRSTEQTGPISRATEDAWFGGLIGVRTIEEFNDEVRERRWAHYPNAFSQHDLSNHFYTLDQLEKDIGSGVIRPDAIDVFANGQLVRFGDLHHKSGRSHDAVVIDQLRQGSMVRVRDLQDARQQVRHTVRLIEKSLLGRCQANLYLGPTAGAGFPAHFDISDGFVVQLSGAKEWTVYEEYVDQMRLPAADTPWEPDRYRPLGQGQHLVLNAGDVLYLPRGVMHAARCTDQHSLHLTISLESLTYADVLAAEIRRLAHEVPNLRCRVPWSWEGNDDLLTAPLRDQMRALIDHVDAGPSLQAGRRELVQSQDAVPGELRRSLTQPN